MTIAYHELNHIQTYALEFIFGSWVWEIWVFNRAYSFTTSRLQGESFYESNRRSFKAVKHRNECNSRLRRHTLLIT